MTREVLIAGAGIVGATIALELAGGGAGVTVLERDVGSPRGSKAFAPGFIGIYNDTSVLAELADASANIYDGYPAAFQRVGGLELATSDAGADEIRRRSNAARALGLPARLVEPTAIPDPVSAFVDTERVTAAAFMERDGVADVPALLRLLRDRAASCGVRFIGGQEIIGLEPRGHQVATTTTSGEVFVGDDVVLAGGIWGPTLTALTGRELPLFPFAHPYVYSRADQQWAPGPFVRWPEHHVYARVHHDRLGIGSYDHFPVPVRQSELAEGARLPWDESFTPVIDAAQDLLNTNAQFEPAERINGVFAVTPDNLPFLGPHPELDNVWVAQAIWVTHAAGAAASLARAMVDAAVTPPELAVDRFDGMDPTDLSLAAQRLYRDIYANDSA